MTTKRKPTTPTTEAVDQFCAQFDDLFNRWAARQAFRQYLIGLLLPREHNKALTVLASLVPDADRQALHHFLHDAPWDASALNKQRLALWLKRPDLAPHVQGVLIIDETGDRKRGRGIVLAAQQYIGKLGHTANGVVSVTSHWADGMRHVPLGVRAYHPASRLPQGKTDPEFRTKPELAWELIEEARGQGIPFRVVVADCVYGENAKLEGRLFTAKIGYVLALRPNKGTWQFVEDEANPPAFTPAEAARRVPREAWVRLVRKDSHGKEIVRFVAELALGMAYGPDKPVRLIAATDDPEKLKADFTWYMATNLPIDQANPIQVYELYCLRDWIEHYYKPVKHELGWADYQVRSAEAIVRHWHLVMLAYTFSLLAGIEPAMEPKADGSAEESGEKTRQSADCLERGTPSGAGLAQSLGKDQPLLETLVEEASTR
jgi:DDE superfamily endonuclease